MTNPPKNRSGVTRREFLENSTRNAACVTAGAFGLGGGVASANDRLQVGVIGLGSQGKDLAVRLAGMNHVQVTAICDVDARALAESQHEIGEIQRHRPIAVAAHEQLIHKSDVDAIVVATPDHWHELQAIDVLKSRKHLFLETPVAHSILEGERLMRVASKSNSIVQVGLPQRCGEHFASAVQLVQSGFLGKIHLARAWAVHRRKSIGYCAPTQAPVGVDYDRWLGPAEKKSFQENRFHGNWCWFWDYGSGELGKWGTHNLDLILWALKLNLPTKISAVGGIRSFRDDRETPDTVSVSYEYPDLDVIWEHRQWDSRGIEGRTSGTAFYGENGTLVIDRSGWKVYGHQQERYADASEIKTAQLSQFLNAIVSGTKPTASLEAGQKVSALCHLGNIAYRIGRTVQFDAKTISFINDPSANQLLASAAVRQ